MNEEKFLIVDDEEGIRRELAAYFNRYGVQTFEAGSTEEAKAVLLRERISLATVDVVMPGESGLELTRWIASETDVPVILLTSLDDVVDRVAGLEVGADDYLSKPFEPRELLARARAVLRRREKVISAINAATNNDNQEISEHTRERVKLGGWIFNKSLRLLSHPERNDIQLGYREFLLISVLQQCAGTVVGKEELINRVYEREWNPEDRNLDNLVARLRKKVEYDSSCPQNILTMRSKGFMFAESFITEVIE